MTPHTDASAFLQACRGGTPDHVPVWFMRQAGRSLPEYRRLREGIGMLDACFTTDLIVEITMQPVRRYNVDAAIFFSDIVVPLKAIGVDVDIVAGTGPVIDEPIRTAEDIDRLRDLTADDIEPISAAARSLVDELAGVPLIGFAGAPFTLASYLIEGGPSRDHRRTKQFMYSNPRLWHRLLDRLATIATQFLRFQVEAGAEAVQLFDSWAGALSRADYLTYVYSHSSRVLAELADLGIPRIHFGVTTGELLPDMGEAGADVIGVDWRTPLDRAIERVGPRYAVQGNLDPSLVFAPTDVMLKQAEQILDAGRQARGHVFNLGHGVMPDTDPDALARLVDFVHEYPCGTQ